VAALLWFRLLDLHVLGLIGLVTAASVMPATALWVAAAALWLLALLILFKLHQTGHSRLSGWLNTRSQKLATAFDAIPQTANQFWRSWLWTAVNWLIKLAIFSWLLSIFIQIPVPAAILGAIGGDLSSVLPIHGLAGSGTYEAGVVAGLSLLAQPALSDFLQAAVNLHLFVLGATILGYCASFALPSAATAPIQTNK
jgi:uncharacterized membrane protein YbhN (UPF0104 family)